MPSGKFEPDENGTMCFRPFVPTPPPLARVADLLERASYAVREFDRRLRTWGDPRVAGGLFARLDAVCSSGAEGSTTTFTDLLEYESSLGTAPDVADAASVSALAEATLAPTPDDLIETIRLLHRRLFERGPPTSAKDAGELKRRTNRTMDSDAPGGMFTYTRPQSVRAALDEWKDFVLEVSPELPESVRQNLGHWMFEHIHPTPDGNGRVGRLLIPMLLRAKEFTTQTSAYVSEPVFHEKQLYVEALKHARVTGDMMAFTRVMLGFMAQAASANLGRLDALERLRDEWRGKTSHVRADSVLHRLREYALTKPAFTVSDAARDVGGSFASVNEAVKTLVEVGILGVRGDRRRDRLFQATEILDIFDHFRTPKRDEAPGWNA